jgi:hypothetical protein
LYYEKFEKMSTDELNAKLAKLHDMKHFYGYMQNHVLSQNIKDMIETCYVILDERRQVEYLKEYLPQDGVVIDTEIKQDETDTKEPRRKKRNRSPL